MICFPPNLVRRRTHRCVLAVSCASGHSYHIPAHHTVFIPLGVYHNGSPIDPGSVPCVGRRAENVLIAGQCIIIDNRVEIVQTVTRLSAEAPES